MYKKGYMFEWKVKKLFEKHGFYAKRSPASKPYDIEVIKDGKIVFLVECKKTSKNVLYVYGLEELVDVAKKFGALPLLVYGFYRTPPYVKIVMGDKEKVLKDETHITLEEYLRGDHPWKRVKLDIK